MPRASGKVLALGVFAAGAVVMVVALSAAGGAPEPLPAGLTGAGMPTSWAVPVLRLLADLAAIATAGAVLAAAWLLPSEDGKLAKQGLRACQDAAVAAAVWAVASIGGLMTTASIILGVPLSQLASRAGDAGSLSQVRFLAVSVVMTAVLAVVLSGARTVATVWVAVVLIEAALIGPLLTGHGAIEQTAFWSILATVSLVVHVFCATAWIGGLGALLRYGRGQVAAVEKFSRLALGCAITIGVTGLLTAEIHLGGHQDGWGLITQWVTTGYGALVFAKSAAFALLVWIGWLHRRATLPALVANEPTAFWRLAALELVVMAGTVGLAVALSRTP
ncbi:copper resistance D family protein [Kribbella sp. CA-293567]|uniref:copper resistance D family protein n=1 Tax=Kribbella sp. CA-293567 TaxID=3002436 RepID=UPI0022DDF44A|nr:CopD family protein [Kribbella sp. CA-293567]WBQ06738.1 CopD family protein [Kribbella sp. CA-293567]